MKYIISYLLVFVLAIVITSCSDISDEITTPLEISVHGEGVLNSSSEGFHGNLITDNGFNDCQQCHASDLSGGVTDVSCNGCHSSIDVHKAGIDDVNSENFHGKYFISPDKSLNSCAECHGENYEGSSVSPTCSSSGCHNGLDVHKDGFNTPSSENFHGNYIRNHGWDLGACSDCHGESYAGGVSSPTCGNSGCHTSSEGPEACNTCHGDFNDPSKTAPPQDTRNRTLTSNAGVGAHSAHLFDTAISNEVQCNECHIVPSNFEAPGHIDSDSHTEIVFGQLATSTVSDPDYSFSQFTCSNTYCHGNFEFLKSESNNQFAYLADKMEGNNFTPIWNKVDGTQAECGSCHGLPPIGHIPSTLENCKNCHPGVVNEAGEIINKAKHINGVANVFGN